MKNLVKGLFMFLLCSVLFGCQAEPIHPNECIFKEEGISASEFYESEIKDELTMEFSAFKGKPITEWIREVESDSKYVVFRLYIPIGSLTEDEIESEAEDFLEEVKHILKENGYKQKIYLEIYNPSDEYVLYSQIVK